jgi:hypothetical protein
MDLGRLLRLAPVQERFGPSLPQILAPRLDRLPAIARRIAAGAALVAVAVIVALVLRSHDPTFTWRGAPVAFTTPYPRSLTREPTPKGAIVLLAQHDASGALVASYEVRPLTLPSYRGEISASLAVAALNYIRAFTATAGPTYRYGSSGRTRVYILPGYTYTYSRDIGGARYFGRVVWLTPQINGTRGLLITMLTLPSALRAATAPNAPTHDDVGRVGSVLFEPLQRLRFH